MYKKLYERPDLKLKSEVMNLITLSGTGFDTDDLDNKTKWEDITL